MLCRIVQSFCMIVRNTSGISRTGQKLAGLVRYSKGLGRIVQKSFRNGQDWSELPKDWAGLVRNSIKNGLDWSGFLQQQVGFSQYSIRCRWEWDLKKKQKQTCHTSTLNYINLSYSSQTEHIMQYIHTIPLCQKRKKKTPQKIIANLQISGKIDGEKWEKTCANVGIFFFEEKLYCNRHVQIMNSIIQSSLRHVITCSNILHNSVSITHLQVWDAVSVTADNQRWRWQTGLWMTDSHSLLP